MPESATLRLNEEARSKDKEEVPARRRGDEGLEKEGREEDFSKGIGVSKKERIKSEAKIVPRRRCGSFTTSQ